jgi:hypothetical protein
MKFGVAVAVAVLALSGAGTANAQVQPPQERINTALARARQVGIPVSLLESKIAEGKAKGVSLDRIAAAIERREAALVRASEALRGQPDAAESLGVSADAIELGVSEAALKAVSENAPRERRTVAIAVLTELVKQGHASDVALSRVRDALRRGPDALSNLPAESAAGRGGGPPDGRGQSQGQGQGQGNSGGGRGGGNPGPPGGVPTPGQPPQSGRPDGAGNSNRPADPGRPGGPPSNPGRGR